MIRWYGMLLPLLVAAIPNMGPLGPSQLSPDHIEGTSLLQTDLSRTSFWLVDRCGLVKDEDECYKSCSKHGFYGFRKEYRCTWHEKRCQNTGKFGDRGTPKKLLAAVCSAMDPCEKSALAHIAAAPHPVSLCTACVQNNKCQFCSEGFCQEKSKGAKGCGGQVYTHLKEGAVVSVAQQCPAQAGRGFNPPTCNKRFCKIGGSKRCYAPPSMVNVECTEYMHPRPQEQPQLRLSLYNKFCPAPLNGICHHNNKPAPLIDAFNRSSIDVNRSSFLQTHRVLDTFALSNHALDLVASRTEQFDTRVSGEVRRLQAVQAHFQSNIVQELSSKRNLERPEPIPYANFRGNILSERPDLSYCDFVIAGADPDQKFQSEMYPEIFSSGIADRRWSEKIRAAVQETILTVFGPETAKLPGFACPDALQHALCRAINPPILDSEPIIPCTSYCENVRQQCLLRSSEFPFLHGQDFHSVLKESLRAKLQEAYIPLLNYMDEKLPTLTSFDCDLNAEPPIWKQTDCCCHTPFFLGAVHIDNFDYNQNTAVHGLLRTKEMMVDELGIKPVHTLLVGAYSRARDDWNHENANRERPLSEVRLDFTSVDSNPECLSALLRESLDVDPFGGTEETALLEACPTMQQTLHKELTRAIKDSPEVKKGGDDWPPQGRSFLPFFAGPEDSLIFLLGGHGYGGGVKLNNGAEYTAERLLNDLYANNKKRRFRRTLMYVASCYSGGIFSRRKRVLKYPDNFHAITQTSQSSFATPTTLKDEVPLLRGLDVFTALMTQLPTETWVDEMCSKWATSEFKSLSTWWGMQDAPQCFNLGLDPLLEVSQVDGRDTSTADHKVRPGWLVAESATPNDFFNPDDSNAETARMRGRRYIEEEMRPRHEAEVHRDAGYVDKFKAWTKKSVQNLGLRWKGHETIEV